MKLAPVIRELRKSSFLRPIVVCTSQHGDIAAPVLRTFGIRSFHDLGVMRRDQTLWHLSGRLITTLGEWFTKHRAEAVLVQGDTSSALLGGLAAFYHQIPVGHVEAGLRTGNRYFPFPEEMNRSLLAHLANWHFTPTRTAGARLRANGVPANAIFQTGNTVVDALRWITRSAPKVKGAHPLVLVTCHRRENLGVPMRRIAKALAAIALRHPEVLIVFPVHPNPRIATIVGPALHGFSNVRLMPPMPYVQFIDHLQRATCVITDSGGVQEEAAALGKPVLVLRNETERQEGLKAGLLRLVGTDRDAIVTQAHQLLTRRNKAEPTDVFGDGHAAERIVRILEIELPAARRSTAPTKSRK